MLTDNETLINEKWVSFVHETIKIPHKFGNIFHKNIKKTEN